MVLFPSNALGWVWDIQSDSFVNVARIFRSSNIFDPNPTHASKICGDSVASPAEPFDLDVMQ
eukprot:CAMPEP_0171321588 /NCGR_PEP_ID=MMETSP0816-20121228/113240_1 /TAXON_ID=420281 /ORGANISM="Proboscia inermis, Strain CCAP1064/1" /LENGTH=61 /DNA_ID=CAMNT_0011819721 /DNA_START=324 /DNA_END=509 /DNA_ORIENTATION=+